MWVATIYGFFSAVQDREHRGCVLVRARAKADIWNLYRQFSTAYEDGRRGRRFKMSKPKANEHRDYRWRISMKQRDWAAIVYRLAMRIDYHNFKDAVHEQPDQSNKNSAYLSVWSAMLRVQHMEDPNWHGQSHQPYFYNWDRELDFAKADETEAIPFEDAPDHVLENKQEPRTHELSDAEFRKLEE